MNQGNVLDRGLVQPEKADTTRLRGFLNVSAAASGIAFTVAQLIHAADGGAKSHALLIVSNKHVAEQSDTQKILEEMSDEEVLQNFLPHLSRNLNNLGSNSFQNRDFSMHDSITYARTACRCKSPFSREIWATVENWESKSLDAESRERRNYIAKELFALEGERPTLIPICFPASLQEIIRTIEEHSGIQIICDPLIFEKFKEPVTEVPSHYYLKILHYICDLTNTYPHPVNEQCVALRPQSDDGRRFLYIDDSGRILSVSTFLEKTKSFKVIVIADPQEAILGISKEYRTRFSVPYPGQISVAVPFPDNHVPKNNSLPLTEETPDQAPHSPEEGSFSKETFCVPLELYLAQNPHEFLIPLSGETIQISKHQVVVARWNEKNNETHVSIQYNAPRNSLHEQAKILTMYNRYTLLDENLKFIKTTGMQRVCDSDFGSMSIILKSDKKPSNVIVRAYTEATVESSNSYQRPIQVTIQKRKQ